METNSYPTKEDLATMSESQRRFVRWAKRNGHKLMSYSGRCMFGAKCPAVVVSPWTTVPKKYSTDNFGRDMVVYQST
jgi:hypothetical protein